MGPLPLASLLRWGVKDAADSGNLNFGGSIVIPLHVDFGN
jgi:hypothetical protein